PLEKQLQDLYRIGCRAFAKLIAHAPQGEIGAFRFASALADRTQPRDVHVVAALDVARRDDTVAIKDDARRGLVCLGELRDAYRTLGLQEDRLAVRGSDRHAYRGHCDVELGKIEHLPRLAANLALFAGRS